MSSRQALLFGISFFFIIAGGKLISASCGVGLRIGIGYSSLLVCFVYVIWAGFNCWLWWNAFPVCEQNRCKNGDFTCLGRPANVGIIEEGPATLPALVYKCKCGCSYVESGKRPWRFYKIENDNQLKKYKIKHYRLSCWENDDDSHAQ